MKWTLDYSDKARKQLKKLDYNPQKIILSWLYKNIDGCDNPRAFGKPLSANLKNQWRYKIGNYRVLCDIQDNNITVLALNIGHRSRIYKEK